MLRYLYKILSSNRYRALTLCSLTLCLSMLSSSCAEPRISLQIEVASLPGAVDRLEVTPFLNGQPSSQGLLVVTRRLDRFELDLPPESRGILRLHVSALRKDGCGLASADLRIPLAYPDSDRAPGSDAIHDGVRELRVELTQEPNPCSVTVGFRGNGSATVTSSPPGLACRYDCEDSGCATTGICSWPFAADQTVTLQARPDLNTSLYDWLGACTGYGVCVVNTRGDAKTVTAVLGLPPTCTAANWCTAEPERDSDEITAPFRSTNDGLYFGRGYSGLWRYSEAGELSQLAALGSATRQRLRQVESRRAGNVWAIGDSGLLIHVSGGHARQEVRPVPIKAFVVMDHPDPALSGIVAITEAGLVEWIVDAASDADPGAKFHVVAFKGLMGRLDGLWTDGKGALLIRGIVSLWSLSLSGDPTLWPLQFAGEWQNSGGLADAVIAIAGQRLDDIWLLTDRGEVFPYAGLARPPIGTLDCQSYGCQPAKLALVSETAGQVYVVDNHSAVRTRVFRAQKDRTWQELSPPNALGQPPSGGWRVVATADGSLTLIESPDGPPEFGRLLLTHKLSDLTWQPALIVLLPTPDPLEKPDFVAVAGGAASELWLLSQAGEIYRRRSAQLEHFKSFSRPVLGLWAQGGENIWFVGEAGLVVHFDGQQLHRLKAPTTKDLKAVWGSAYTDVWIGGTDTLLHFDGTRFQNADIMREGLHVEQLSGSDAGNVWASRLVFSDSSALTELFRWNGTEWLSIDMVAGRPMGLIAVQPDEAWLSGGAVRVLRFRRGPVGYTHEQVDVARSSVVPMPTSVVLWRDGVNVYALGNRDSDTRGLLQVVETGSPALIRAVAGQGADLWAVGDDSAILRYRPLTYQSP